MFIVPSVLAPVPGHLVDLRNFVMMHEKPYRARVCDGVTQLIRIDSQGVGYAHNGETVITSSIICSCFKFTTLTRPWTRKTETFALPVVEK